MATKLPSGQWRVRWRIGDRRCSKSFPNKELAIKFESQIQLNLVKKEVFDENSSSTTFKDFSEIWINDYCKVEKARTQWATDASLIRIHVLPELGAKRLDELKRSDLEILKRKLRSKDKRGIVGKKLTPKTVNNILSLVKKMMSIAVDWDVVHTNPFLSVKLVKKVKQPFSYWTLRERDSFLKQCLKVDREFHDAVQFACNTGLRLGELAGLRWESVDFDRKMITVSESYNFGLKTQLKRTKNGDFSDVPMNSAVSNLLKSRKRVKKQSSFVFDKNLLKDACKKLKRKCRRFGVKEIRFHDLRHTFASCLAMAGVDLMVIKELMRHKSYSMTLRYAHLHPEHLVGKTEVLCDFVAQLGHEKKDDFLPGPRMGHERENNKVVNLFESRN